jgi:hypothetical protein
MDEIESARRCIPIVQSIIEAKTQDRVVNILSVQQDRQFLFKTEKGLSYIQVFKHNFFMSFGAIFGKKGIGESINEEMIDFAEKNGVNCFLFVYPNGNVYAISVKELKDYAIANGTIRTTSSGERTFSVPITLLRRWN